MNHHIFEEMLFKDLETVDLDEQQTSSLQQHLAECESCRKLAASWHDLESHLHAEQLTAPGAGFTERWYERLEGDRVLVLRRQTLAFTIFVLGGSAILFFSLLILAFPVLEAPKVLLWAWFYQLASIFNNMEPLGRVLSILFGSFENISPLGWILFAGLLSELAVLWLVFYRVLMNPRRVSQ